MVPIGEFSELKIVKILSFGAYLDAGEEDEILLPIRRVPKDAQPGDVLRVFIYKDSENRPIATTSEPKITLNRFANLEVKDVNKYGAFLEWGVENQLMVPYREQREPMQTGKRYVVMLYHDRVSDRLAATSKLDKHLQLHNGELTVGQEVTALIYAETDLGYNAVVDQRFQGLIYGNEVYQPLRIGNALTAYVKTLREDGGIDLTVNKPGLEGLVDHSERIYQALQQSHGFLPLNDDSSPDAIRDILHMSKKSFKRAVGILYKERKIEIADDGIRLISE